MRFRLWVNRDYKANSKNWHLSRVQIYFELLWYCPSRTPIDYAPATIGIFRENVFAFDNHSSPISIIVTMRFRSTIGRKIGKFYRWCIVGGQWDYTDDFFWKGFQIFGNFTGFFLSCNPTRVRACRWPYATPEDIASPKASISVSTIALRKMKKGINILNCYY